MTNRDDLPQVRGAVGGVPEALVRSLCRRAPAAQRPRPALDDPKPAGLVEQILLLPDQLSGDRAGRGHARRVRKPDMAIRRFLVQHCGGTAVALGEGLETQFWRLDSGQLRWFTVDMTERSPCGRGCCRTAYGSA